MAVVVAQSFNNAWSAPDTTGPNPPPNHNLQVNVSAIADGSWLIALVGWQQPGFVPTVVSVGDDAANYWQPIATSPVAENAYLNTNPDFNTNTTGWTPSNATIALATNEFFTPPSSGLLTPNGTSSTVQLFATTVSVNPNSFYTASFYAYSPAGYASVEAGIVWATAGSVFISTTTGNPTILAPDTWTQVTVSGQAPANAGLGEAAFIMPNRPNAWDIVYVDHGTFTMGNGFSAVTRCAIWAAPNVRSSVTTVSICPLGQVTAIAATVLDVTGMPAWLQTNTAARGLAKTSSTLNVTVTPTKNSLVVSTGALDNLTYTLNQLRAGWSSASYLKTTTNGLDTNGDVAVIGRTQVTSSAITASFYGVKAINANPDFVTNTTGWQGVNGTLALSSLGFISAHSALLTPNGTSATVTAQITHATAPAVTVGTTYVGNTWVQATGSTASVKVGLEWLTGGGATISTTFSTDLSVPADGTWWNLEIQGIAPATAATASLHVAIDGTPPVTRKLNVAEGAVTTVTNAAMDLAGAVAAFQLAPTSEPTQPNANWPNVRLEVAFGQQASTTPDQLVWTDISNRLLAFTTDRGRQYELNSLQAGNATLQLRNDDGYLTPGSSLDPGLTVYAPFRLTALYSHRVYGVFQGFMERWPQTWVDAHFGIVPATGVDAWAMFTATLQSVVRSEVLLNEPTAYWPCADGSSFSSATNIGVTPNQTPLVIKQSAFGPGSSATTFGDSTITLSGDTATDWVCNKLTSAQVNNGSSLVYSGSPLPPLTGNGVTFQFWMFAFSTGPILTQATILFSMIGAGGPILALSMDTLGRLHILTWNVNTGAMTDHGPTGSGYGGDKWLITIYVTTTGYVFTIDGGIVEGILTGTDTLASTCSYFVLNGRNDPFAVQQFANVAFSQVAVYPRALNQSRVLAQAFAGISAISTEYGDFRVSRLISYLTWAPPQRIYTDTFLMTGANDISGQVVGSAINNIAQTEQALLYVDRLGYLVYRTRRAATNQGIQAVLGENTAAGELPYRVTLTLDYDPQYINNDVQVRHVGNIPHGSTTNSSTDILLRNNASINQFGDHSLQVNSYFDSVTQSTDLANYLLSQYSVPLMRVSQVELIPGANPTLFATVLGFDIGDRITLNRRPVGAPTITLQAMIIGIHHDVEWKTGKWSVKLDIMPASIAVLQTKTLTLNDAVLGKLDSTNVVGW